jgi:hypothetical protein
MNGRYIGLFEIDGVKERTVGPDAARVMHFDHMATPSLRAARRACRWPKVGPTLTPSPIRNLINNRLLYAAISRAPENAHA